MNRTEPAPDPLAEFDRFFVQASASCPYGLPHKAKYKYVHLGVRSTALTRLFLEHGFRRNGNSFYTMVCDDCDGCVPIRLTADRFRPNRNQLRTARKNRDLRVVICPPEMNRDNLLLLDKFLGSRYPGHANAASDYYATFFLNYVSDTYEVHYSCGNRLLGVAIVDICDQSCNAVYFYFDPEMAERSPGTFNIIWLLEFCGQRSIEHLYLGYWIENVRSMQYKAGFKPHSLLIDNQWLPVEKV